MKRHLDLPKPKSEVIELQPFGITTGMDKARPVMLFREKDGEAVLPVWLSPLDAGIALTQHDKQTHASSPHDVPVQALAVLGVRAESCHFSEVKGHQQYVEIKFSGSRKLKFMKVRADHAVSFCLQARVKFFCTRGFIDQCRRVDAELGNLQAGLGARPGARKDRQQYWN
jgi:uncharacterized protein